VEFTLSKPQSFVSGTRHLESIPFKVGSYSGLVVSKSRGLNEGKRWFDDKVCFLIGEVLVLVRVNYLGLGVRLRTIQKSQQEDEANT